MLVGYARVSTEDQDSTLQKAALVKAGCSKIYDETISSGVRARPQLEAALEFVRRGDVLIVWKLDRMARSVSELITIIEKLRERGVGFQSLTETIDTTSAGGRLLFHIMSALAEFERAIIRERTRAGLASARARGRVGGRKPKLSAEEKQMAETLLANAHIPVADIARQLGVSKQTFYRYFPGGRGACVGRSGSGREHPAT